MSKNWQAIQEKTIVSITLEASEYNYWGLILADSFRAGLTPLGPDRLKKGSNLSENACRQLFDAHPNLVQHGQFLLFFPFYDLFQFWFSSLEGEYIPGYTILPVNLAWVYFWS